MKHTLHFMIATDPSGTVMLSGWTLNVSWGRCVGRRVYLLNLSSAVAESITVPHSKRKAKPLGLLTDVCTIITWMGLGSSQSENKEIT